MKKTILFLTTILTLMLVLAGCTDNMRFTDTVWLDTVDATDIKTLTITSNNVTTAGLNADNATLAILILKNLPTADPGISGTVWSDNGTLRISK